jgi:hypothetical protein
LLILGNAVGTLLLASRRGLLYASWTALASPRQVITAAAYLLVSDHARGKLPAVQLLRMCAARPEYSSKVTLER